MSITAEQERAYYDKRYGWLLTIPEQQLGMGPESYFALLDNPATPYYERRRLFRGTLERVLAEPLEGRAVLDYGCGAGDWGITLALHGAQVTMLDLSPVAIEVCERRARASGVAERVRSVARSADDLSCFADGEFDTVVGSGALHHTLKYPGSLAELARVMKAGGKGFFAETLDNNPLLRWSRRVLWRLIRQPAESGEDIILRDRELDLLRQHFRRVETEPLNLLAMAKRLFRGHYDMAGVQGFLRGLEGVDAALLAVLPPLKRYCGEIILVVEK